jgi:hypothetical protein
MGQAAPAAGMTSKKFPNVLHACMTVIIARRGAYYHSIWGFYYHSTLTDFSAPIILFVEMLKFFFQKVHFSKNQNFVKEIKESFQVPMNILLLYQIFKINFIISQTCVEAAPILCYPLCEKYI